MMCPNQTDCMIWFKKNIFHKLMCSLFKIHCSLSIVLFPYIKYGWSDSVYQKIFRIQNKKVKKKFKKKTFEIHIQFKMFDSRYFGFDVIFHFKIVYSSHSFHLRFLVISLWTATQIDFGELLAHFKSCHKLWLDGIIKMVNI